MQSPFYLTLPSNASMQIYENTTTCYTIKLSKPIQLKGEDWEVALVEIIYPISFHNIKEGDGYVQLAVTAEEIMGNGSTQVDVPKTPFAVITKMGYTFTMPGGYY